MNKRAMDMKYASRTLVWLITKRETGERVAKVIGNLGNNVKFDIIKYDGSNNEWYNKVDIIDYVKHTYEIGECIAKLFRYKNEIDFVKDYEIEKLL